jgi:RPA family protein
MAESIISNNQSFKRNIAYKLKIGSILSGNPILENEKLKLIETESKQVVRVNLIANIIEKFIQDDEKKYGSVTLDDATGQIKAKVFGEDLEKIKNLTEGDTILTIGLIRIWNNELYLTPEIIKKKDPKFLLVRKMEIDSTTPKVQNKEKLIELKEKMIEIIKNAEKDDGIYIDKIILDLKESPDVINQEIKKLLENGIIYEPRPGKLRYLG